MFNSAWGDPMRWAALLLLQSFEAGFGDGCFLMRWSAGYADRPDALVVDHHRTFARSFSTRSISAI
jgi:hypothetical protein